MDLNQTYKINRPRCWELSMCMNTSTKLQALKLVGLDQPTESLYQQLAAAESTPKPSDLDSKQDTDEQQDDGDDWR